MTIASDLMFCQMEQDLYQQTIHHEVIRKTHKFLIDLNNESPSKLYLCSYQHRTL